MIGWFGTSMLCYDSQRTSGAARQKRRKRGSGNLQAGNSHRRRSQGTSCGGISRLCYEQSPLRIPLARPVPSVTQCREGSEFSRPDSARGGTQRGSLLLDVRRTLLLDESKQTIQKSIEFRYCLGGKLQGPSQLFPTMHETSGRCSPISRPCAD